MKQTQAYAVPRPSAAKRGVARGARIQAKTQSGAGNHRRQRYDSFERQADDLAHRIVRGETNVARRITPIAAASLRVSGSSGSPLPADIRQEMETGFGANLNAVRIHNDSAASTAAEHNAADAFASGTDIYFRRGRYRPSTTDGRILLAHELAHVLQQTGRSSTDGRLHATPVVGTGEIQCFPPDGTSAEDAFGLLVSRYQGRASAPDLQSTIDEVRALLGSRLPSNQPDSARPLADAVRTFQSRSGIARGFILDCLKVMGAYEAAYTLIDADARFEIQDSTAQIEFLQFLNSPPRTAGWIGEALRLPEFQSFWPNTIVRAYREFFLQPHSAPPAELADLTARVDAEFQRRANLESSTELVPQERVLLAWVLLHQIDLLRVQSCTEARSTSGATTAQVTATELRLRLLQNLVAREQIILDDEQQPTFMHLLAERLLAMAREVQPLLEAAGTDYRAWVDQFGRVSDADLLASPAARFPHSALTRPFLQTLRSILVSRSRDLLALDNSGGSAPTLPASSTYAQHLTALRNALDERIPAVRGRAAAPSLFAQLDAAFAQAARAHHPNRETIAALGLLSLILDKLVQFTLLYDQAQDEATPHFADELGGHRLQMARALARIARWLQWDDLLDLCRPVLTADGSDQVQLWMISDWEPEAPQPIDTLASDFADNLNHPIIRNTPLTVRHLVDWFHLDYNTRLRVVLRDLVRPEDRATADTAVPIARILALQQSRAEVSAAMTTPELERAAAEAGAPPAVFDLRVPQRFVVRQWEASFPPGAAYEWDRVIEDHPKTQLSIERHRPQNQYSALIFPTRPQAGVFAWLMPSLRPLIELLRSLASLNHVAGGAELTDEQWLFNLSQEQLSDARWREVDQRIHDQLELRNRAVEQDLPDLWLRLNILRRRILVMQLRPRLAAYVSDQTVAGPIGETGRQQTQRLNTASDTLREIYAYQATVIPQESADVQVSLLLIQLADVMDGIVSNGHPEAEFGRGIYPYLTAALGWLDGTPSKLSELRRATNVYDEAGNIVYIDRNLQAAKTHLENLKRAIDATYREAQDTIGFSSENGQTIRSSLREAPEIFPSHQPGDSNEWIVGGEIGPDMQVDPTTGTSYRLLEVYRRFSYHPQVGSPGSTDSPGLTARYTDENGTEYPHVGADGQTVPIPHDPLFRIEIGGQPHEIYADDALLLSSLNDTFMWRSFQIEMINLGAETEAYMQWVMTAVGVLVPEAMYAEIGTSIVQMVASGQIEEIVRQIREDPGELLRRLVERLRDELFTPENVWRFVLLGGQHNPFEALEGFLPTRARARVTVPPASRLARILGRLRQLGQYFSRALHRVQLYADGPIRSVQGFIAQRPTLGWLFQRAAHLFEAAIDLIPPEVLESLQRAELPGTPDAIIAAAQDTIADAEHDAETSTVRLLETIAHFELPYELLDLDAATELIVGFVVDRFGPRARAIRLVLNLVPIPQEEEGRFTGLRSMYQYLCAEIARVWRDSPIDPNVYWRERMLPLIGSKFTETRDDLVDGLYLALNGFLGQIGRPKLTRPGALPDTHVEAVQPEAEPSLVPQRLGRGSWQLRTVGGTPLPATTRKPLERGFSQQFSHVRLHQGSEGRAATEPVGADAVTSGSHVFVHPSRSLTNPAGRGLLAHELTHVVQQTGSHPLGARPPSVRSGRAHRGLQINPHHEAQATHIARHVGSGRLTRIPPTGTPPIGPQPALSERIVNSVIDTITTSRESQDFVATVHGGSASHVPGIDVARQLWSQVRGLFDTMTFAAFLNVPTGTSVPEVSNTDIHALIRQQLRDRGEEIIDGHIPGIAQLAQRPRRNRQASDPETELNPARFVNLLEDYIAAERGIGINLRLDETANRITAAHVHNVLLQNVGGTSHLWRIAMYRSFSGHSTDIPDLSHAQGEVRQRLRSLPPSPAIFSPLSFAFSTLFVDDYLELVRSRGRTVDDIPTVRDYTNTRNNRADSLAVGTHGDLSGRGIGAYGRESHHTSQYLLVEFFGNLEDATRNAFPAHHTRYPSGVEFKSGSNGEVNRIRSGGRFLEVGQLSPTSGRGDAMPAILLAARTHRRGELHVMHEPRWNPESDERIGTQTQGFAIENRFNGFLPPELRPHNSSEAQKQRFQAEIDRDEPRVNRALYNAAVSTYHWMYDRMIPQLRNGLITEELAYYRGVAALSRQREGTDNLDPNYDMTAAHLVQVWEAAKRNNDHVMSGYGWPTP